MINSNKKNFNKLINSILYLLLFISNLSAQTVNNHFIIASGSRGGNYYETGKLIASQFNDVYNNASFSVIETNGSSENIELLKNNSVDFAIVQRNILINNLYKNENKGIKNLTVISPLFQEKLHIYFYGKQPLKINKLEHLFKSKTINIDFTSKKGYSHKIFYTLTKFLNVNTQNISETIDNYNVLITKLKNHKIDFLVTFSLPLTALENNDSIQKLYISKNDALIIQNRLHNIYATKLQDSTNHYSIGSWSFLVGSKSSLQLIKPENRLFKSISTIKKDSLKPVSYFISKSLNSFIQNKHNEISQLKSLPLSPSLYKNTHFAPVYYKTYIIILFVFIIAILYFKHTKKYNFNFLYIWKRYKHFQYGFLMLLFLFFFSIELLIHAEKMFYENVGIKSQILNMTRPDLYSWILIATVTGNSNGTFPLSLLGKSMVALNSMNFWIGTILIGFSEYTIYKINKKRKLGLMETKHSNHIVIFGWNTMTEKFIIETIQDAKMYNNTKINIVCVVSNMEKIRNNNSKIKTLHDSNRIDIIEGNALETGTLKLSHVERANTVILLSDDQTKLSDERTAMRAHAISRYVKKQKNNGIVYKTNTIKTLKQKIKNIVNKNIKEEITYKKYKIEKTADTIYMIAELNDENLKDTLIDADVNEIITAGNYKKAIIKQSLFNHGISKVLDEIMQYNEYNEFYKIDLSKQENSHLRNKNFDQLLIVLRKQGILLVGIHIVFHDENDNIIIDQSIIKELLLKEEAKGINRDIIINPTNEIECSRLVDEDDHLIVLATNIEQLRKGIKNVIF